MDDQRQRYNMEWDGEDYATQSPVATADLRRDGWGVVRQTGSHQIWKHPLLPGVEVNLAGQDGADAHHYQERDVREAVRLAREAQRRQP